MPDPAQLHHLVRLADDPSPVVRDAVMTALTEWGEDLEDALLTLEPPPSLDVITTLREEVDTFIHTTASPSEDDTPPPASPFRPGDLVRHRHYGYRGVIVDVDPECRADDEWYASNRTQPPKDQPWYHVLVDGSQSATYAAQTNLEADEEDDPVDNPFVSLFFAGFEGGLYLRNDRPWPPRP